MDYFRIKEMKVGNMCRHDGGTENPQHPTTVKHHTVKTPVSK
jgi:hypothetical protein